MGGAVNIIGGLISSNTLLNIGSSAKPIHPATDTDLALSCPYGTTGTYKDSFGATR